MPDFISTKVLITVLTYPHPSHTYEELICTAGVTEHNKWVRLYPIDYRNFPKERQFKKYQWIEVGLAEEGHRGDMRIESRRPNRNSICVLGPPISTENGWSRRREIIDKLPVHTMIELESKYSEERISLGIVRPKRIIDLEFEETRKTWNPKQEDDLKQLSLFGEKKSLRKIPYIFRYFFQCEDSTKIYKAPITDWELGVLWLKESERLGDDRKAAESVRKKYLHEICRNDKDTRFFMGTVWPFNTWLVLGVFWPPKVFQPSLFAPE